MTTVNSLVTAALRKIRVVDMDGEATPSEMSTGIEAMNRMVMRWQADGTQLGYAPVSVPTDAAPIPVEAEDAVIYNLAIHLADEYGITPSQTTFLAAAQGLSSLLRDQLVSTPLRAGCTNAPLPDQAWGGRYDVLTDSYR